MKDYLKALGFTSMFVFCILGYALVLNIITKNFGEVTSFVTQGFVLLGWIYYGALTLVKGK